MRLSGRVRMLERRRGVNAPCPGCAGRGAPGITMLINGVERGRRGGCVRCGAMSCLKRIILNYGSEEEAAAARGMWPAGLEATA